MDARKIGRKAVWIVVGAALLFGGPATEAEADGAAALTVYNGGSGGAIDAHWVLGGRRTELADELKPGEAAPAEVVDILRGSIEVRVPGAGRDRLLRKAAQLRDGHAYCVFVLQGKVGVLDVTRRMLRETSPEKVCRQLAMGR